MSKAQTTRRRRPKPGDLGALRRTLWACIRDVEDVLREDDDPDRRLRAAHALSTLSGSYLKAYEAAELVPRLEAIEESLERAKTGGTWAGVEYEDAA